MTMTPCANTHLCCVHCLAIRLNDRYWVTHSCYCCGGFNLFASIILVAVVLVVAVLAVRAVADVTSGVIDSVRPVLCQ